jgi:hypothetical protein
LSFMLVTPVLSSTLAHSIVIRALLLMPATFTLQVSYHATVSLPTLDAMLTNSVAG